MKVLLMFRSLLDHIILLQCLFLCTVDSKFHFPLTLTQQGNKCLQIDTDTLNIFTLTAGSINIPLIISIDLNFEGLALPSQAVIGPNYNYYDPSLSSTSSDQNVNKSIQISHFNFDSQIYSDQICFTRNTMLPKNNERAYHRPKERIAQGSEMMQGMNSPGFCPQDFLFYYMIHVEKSFLYDNQTKIYGYLGISPQSFIDQYGIFRQIPNLNPLMGMQATKAAGQLIIGDYDRIIVKNLANVQWHTNPNENRTQWEMIVKKLQIGSFTLLQRDQNLQLIARISASESGLVIPYSQFSQIKALFDYWEIEYSCDDNGQNGKSICWYTTSCGDLGQDYIVIQNFAGQNLYIPSMIYFEQEPDRCLINIYTLPDSYFADRGLDLILGQALLRNYYTIFDLSKNSIGFYKAAWTQTQKKLSLWGILFLSLLLLILLGGIVGCYRVYKRSKREQEIRIRALSGDTDHTYITHDYKGQPVAIKQKPMKIEEAERLSRRYREANEGDEGQLIREEEEEEEKKEDEVFIAEGLVQQLAELTKEEQNV